MSCSKKSDPKVSIVVPIYKVEKYLKRCIESLLNQTYKNLQIILVDDGSPDICGDICEEFALKDKRIEVYHKENGGLSDARNYGVQYIKGQYTLFLDSDDWIVESCVETLMKNILKNKSDIVQCGFYYAYENFLLYDDRYYEENSEIINLKNQELMKELVKNEKIKNFAWGKLYKTNLIKTIPFEKGVLFEDVFWAHKVMKNVKKYTIVHTPLWYYLQREDSIVSNYTVRNLDILKGLNQRHTFLIKNYPNLINESFKIIFNTSMQHYNIISKLNKKEMQIYKKKIETGIKLNYKEIFKSLDSNWLKAQLIFFKVCPKTNIFPVILNKVLKKLKVIQRDRCLKRIELNVER